LLLLFTNYALGTKKPYTTLLLNSVTDMTCHRVILSPNWPVTDVVCRRFDLYPWIWPIYLRLTYLKVLWVCSRNK